MVAIQHLSMEQLEAGLDGIKDAPKDSGVVHMIVRRPETLGREVVDEGQLDTDEGLVGDNWKGARQRSDCGRLRRPGVPDYDYELPRNRSGCAGQGPMAPGGRPGSMSRWTSAGRTCRRELRLAIGDAVLEVSAKPHTGCGSCGAVRRGRDEFVNSSGGGASCACAASTLGSSSRVRVGGRYSAEAVTLSTLPILSVFPLSPVFAGAGSNLPLASFDGEGGKLYCPALQPVGGDFEAEAWRVARTR